MSAQYFPEMAMPVPPRSRITGRRISARVRLFVPAQVMLLQGQEKCRLDDLSQSGARITLSGRMPRIGAGVVLQIKGLDAFGTVIWVKEQRFGLQFDETVPLPEVVTIRHYADNYAEQETQASQRNARNFVQGRPGLRQVR